MLTEKRKNMIIIKYGDIEVTEMLDADVKSYLESKSSFETDNSFSWKIT